MLISSTLQGVLLQNARPVLKSLGLQLVPFAAVVAVMKRRDPTAEPTSHDPHHKNH